MPWFLPRALLLSELKPLLLWASESGWNFLYILVTFKPNLPNYFLIFKTTFLTVTKWHHRKSALKQGRITEGSSSQYISSVRDLCGISGINRRLFIDFKRNTLLSKRNQTNPLLSVYLIYDTGCAVFSGASQVCNLYFILMPLCEFIGSQKRSMRIAEFCLPFGGYNIYFKAVFSYF